MALYEVKRHKKQWGTWVVMMFFQVQWEGQEDRSPDKGDVHFLLGSLKREAGLQVPLMNP